MLRSCVFCFFFFFNDTATTEIYTLSLHDAFPISPGATGLPSSPRRLPAWPTGRDRKSTRLNSSHVEISYAVFCLKKKNASGAGILESISHDHGVRPQETALVGLQPEAVDAERNHEQQRAAHHLFFFNDTATTEIYTLSLHDALPI